MDLLVVGKCRVESSNRREAAIEVGRRLPVRNQLSPQDVIVDQPVVHLWSLDQDLSKPMIMQSGHQQCHELPVLAEVVGLAEEHDAMVGELENQFGRYRSTVERQPLPLDGVLQLVCGDVCRL